MEHHSDKNNKTITQNNHYQLDVVVQQKSLKLLPKDTKLPGEIDLRMIYDVSQYGPVVSQLLTELTTRNASQEQYQTRRNETSSTNIMSIADNVTNEIHSSAQKLDLVKNECDTDASNKSQSLNDDRIMEQQLVASRTRKITFVCDVCDKKFNKKFNFNRHALIHTGKKPHKCDVCKKEFRKKSHLKEHLLIHTGEKSHMCDVCKREFRHKNNLKEHMLIPTEVKHHMCDVCNKEFIYKKI